MKKILFLLFLCTTFVYASFQGRLVDANTSQPVGAAIVSDAHFSIKSDQNGSFFIDSKEKTYHIKAYGYRPYTFSSDLNTTTIKLTPIKVKALYLTFWGASNNSATLKKY